MSTSTSASDSLSARLFGEPAMNAAMSDSARLQGMLDFEAALARAEARCGLIPASAVEPISAACKLGLYDLAELGDAGRLAGNLAIPMVKALTAAVKANDAEAARFVHWGATSQDAIDTGLVLQLREAFDLLDAGSAALIAVLSQMASEHRDTVMAGRTWLQQAVPVSFGLKAAGWLDALLRQRERLRETRARVLALQFGGAAGTLASLGDRGLDVAQALADELQLTLPALPWHTQRDRIAETGACVALLIGTLGKIARDLSLLMQTEVGEAFEPAAEGKGGSSAMPHKRNPVGCATVLANAMRTPGLLSTLFSAMPQEHERGLGNWPAEWETLPELLRLAAGSLAALTPTLAGLDVQAERMRENLDLTLGLLFAERVSMALAHSLGKQAAHHAIERLSKRVIAERRHLRELICDDADLALRLSPQQLDALFDPAAALGVSGLFIDRALAAAQ
jgi:3-carboxy-cis,cis-muconate cycloisomerase